MCGLDVENSNIKFAAVDATRVPFFQADMNDFRIVRKELTELRAGSANTTVLQAIEALKVDIAALKSNLGSAKKVNSEAENRIKAHEIIMGTSSGCTNPNASSSTSNSYSSRLKNTQVNASLVKSPLTLHDNTGTNNKTDSKWTLVKRKKTIGVNSDTTLTAVKPVQKIHLHVTRLAVTTTEQRLTKYLTDKGVTVLACETLKAKYNAYVLFHVTLEYRNDMPDTNLLDFWPEGVMVRRFYPSKQYGRTN